MGQIVRYLLLAAVCLLLDGVAAFGQTDWDAVLDRYERISRQCLELRGKVVAGEAVADRSLAGLLQELSQLKATLQGASGSMTQAQRKRFARIRDDYARAVGGDTPQKKPQAETVRPKTTQPETGKPESPAAAPSTPAPLLNKYLSLTTIQPLTVRCELPGLSPKAIDLPERRRPSQELHRVTLDHQADVRSARHHLHGFLLASASVPAPVTYGGMAGLTGTRLGGYVSGRSNFTSVGATYHCLSDGSIEGGGRFWGDGTTDITSWTVCGGPVVRLGDHLSVFAGAGLGARTRYWHDIGGNWAEVTDLSFRGLALEAGAIASWHHFALSAGINWLVPARQATAIISLGFSF